MKKFRLIRSKMLVLVLLTTLCALTVGGGIILFNDLQEYRTTRINDMRTQIELLAYSSAAALQFEDDSVAKSNLDLLRLRPTVQA